MPKLRTSPYARNGQGLNQRFLRCDRMAFDGVALFDKKSSLRLAFFQGEMSSLQDGVDAGSELVRSVVTDLRGVCLLSRSVEF